MSFHVMTWIYLCTIKTNVTVEQYDDCQRHRPSRSLCCRFPPVSSSHSFKHTGVYRLLFSVVLYSLKRRQQKRALIRRRCFPRLLLSHRSVLKKNQQDIWFILPNDLSFWNIEYHHVINTTEINFLYAISQLSQPNFFLLLHNSSTPALTNKESHNKSIVILSALVAVNNFPNWRGRRTGSAYLDKTQ